jgi:diguanylate cyclase (GGDEF)-like protein
MVSVLFIMLVAAGNLAVGFVAAVYLGLGPRRWPPESEPEVEADPESVVEEIIEEIVEEEEPPAPPEVAFPAIDPLKQPLVALVEQLSRGFDHFAAELADWDSRRRDGLEGDTLGNAAIELHGLTGAYLEHFQAAMLPLAALEFANQASSAARSSVEAAIDELATQLNQIRADLQRPNEVVTTDQLTTALIQVLAVLHGARDHLEEPLVALLAEQIEDPALMALARQNPQATQLGRFRLQHVWQASELARSAGEPYAAALLDVDSLRQLNAAHGTQLAGRALQALGDLAREVLPPSATIARLKGKQFVLWLPGFDLEAATSVIETLRQQIEQARLRRGSKQLQVTVSAAVLVLGAEDAPETAIEHLRAAAREAKTYGRNRTFAWHAGQALAVDPPKLSIQPRSVSL